MNLIKKARVGDEELRIYQDELPDDPRGWDNLGKMVMWHRNYKFPNEGNFKDPQAFYSWLKENKAVVLSVYMYEHSGIALSTDNSEYPFTDRWDSGQVGFIYCDYETIKKEYSIKRISKATIKRVKEVLNGEIKTYSQYLNNEVYGFILSRIEECNLGHEHLTDIDSCWGFYNIDTIIEEYPQFKDAEWESG